jgi:putative oxidoreductase
MPPEPGPATPVTASSAAPVWGHGLEGTGTYFESAGVRPGRPMAMTAGLCELGGGLLTAVGLVGPVGPGLMPAVMLVAMTQHAGHGFMDSSR